MDKNSKDDDFSNNNSRDREVFLKHLNKLSHKISKPTRRALSSSSTVDFPPTQSQPSTHQPPVYNIDKNDFRDVVQRLTGSPAQPVPDRLETLTPPPAGPVFPVQKMPKPASSRLQKIRPPPLPEIGVRVSESVDRGLTFGQRQPFSPLPALPSVHASAESPISAYMRFYQSSVTANSSNSTFFDTELKNVPPSSLAPGAVPPPSPLPFGCLSPGGFSGGLMFSPNGQLGFSQLPLSPKLPVSSPRQKGH